MTAFLLVVALAQQVLPAAQPMAGGFADPREPRTGLALITSTLFADPLKARPGQGLRSGFEDDDVEGVVSLATNFPLIKSNSAVFSLQGGVTSRFRLEASDNDALSSDYFVALPISFSYARTTGRIRLIHRSSHIGDELVLNSTVRRLEYDHEELDGLAAHQFGGVRAYAGGSVTLASSFTSDKWGVQVGVDTRRRLARRVFVVAGLDWQHHRIAEGNSLVSAKGGIEVNGPGGRLTLAGWYLAGQSPIGEFFLDRERLWGLEMTLGR